MALIPIADSDVFSAVNELYYNHHFKSIDSKQMPHHGFKCMFAWCYIRSNKVDYYKAMKKEKIYNNNNRKKNV